MIKNISFIQSLYPIRLLAVDSSREAESHDRPGVHV